MDQFQTIYENSKFYLPVVTFFIGIMGSIHCSTMCGAFVLTCSDTKKQNIAYQLGRLFSYSVLMSLIFLFSSIINFNTYNMEVALIGSLLLGSGFILVGLKGLVGIKLKLKFPLFIQKRITKIWGFFIAKKKKTAQVSFCIGSLSILLPCGLLYSLVIPLAAIDSYLWAFIAVLSFWLGTLPVMAIAPVLIKRIIAPLKAKAPIVISLFFIFFGLLTIGARLYQISKIPKNSIEMTICH